ncbi:MAG: LCP family protein [Cyanobacteriota bacterium]
MKLLISVIIIVILPLFLFFSSYAFIDSGKVIKPKPDTNISSIRDYSSEEINNNANINTSEKKIHIENPQKAEISKKLRDIKVEDYKETEIKPYKLFLITGTDVVYNYGRKINSTKGRTDAIILAKLSDNSIDLLSIPRDTYVNIPEYGDNKINAANVKGGAKLLKETIENNFNLKIDDYILINTSGVVEFVDLFGGIDFNIPKRMRYNDYSANLFIDLYPGFQHLDGKKVHDLLRFRNDALGDFNRVKREQEVIKAIISQILKPSNILKIPSALYILDNYIETSMSSSKIVFNAKKILEADDIKNKISMQTLPGVGGTKNGIWYWFLDKKETQKIFEELNISTVNTNDLNETIDNNSQNNN